MSVVCLDLTRFRAPQTERTLFLPLVWEFSECFVHISPSPTRGPLWAVSAFSITPQGRKKLVVEGLSEGLHPFTQPAGSEVLHREDKLGPAPDFPDSCLRARPGVWLGCLGSFVPDSFIPGSSTS